MTPSIAYRHVKALALDATVREENPPFSVVTIYPSYIIGRNELSTTIEKLVKGSNGIPLAIVLKVKNSTSLRPNIFSYIDDITRLYIEALDKTKVPEKLSYFFVEGGKEGEDIVFNDIIKLFKKEFPSV